MIAFATIGVEQQHLLDWNYVAVTYCRFLKIYLMNFIRVNQLS